MIARAQAGICGVRGFTLVETVATMVVLAMLAAVTTPMMIGAVESYAVARTRAQLHAEASLAMERITRELRNVAPDAATGGPEAQITAMTPTRIDFNEDDHLRLDDSALRLRTGGAEATLATDVSAFRLEPTDASDEPVAMPVSDEATGDVRRIRVEIELSRDGVTERLASKVFLRAGMSAEAAP